MPPYTAVVMIFCCSRSAGTSTTERIPARAAAAATALARFPVDGQARTLNPISSAAASATATNAVLEGMGRVVPVIFDPQPPHAQGVRQVVRPDQAGVARLGGGPGSDVRGHREQLGVTPHVPRAGLDIGPGQGREVVGHLERAETVRTGVVRPEFTGQAAFPARQVGGVTEPRHRRCRAAGGYGAVLLGAAFSAPFFSVADVLTSRGPFHPHLSRDHPDHGPELAPLTTWPRAARCPDGQADSIAGASQDTYSCGQSIIVTVAGASQGRSLHPSR